MNAYEHLKGWEEFQDTHLPPTYSIRAIILFGLFMSGSSVSQSKRQAKTEVAEALQNVAQFIRKDCVSKGIPLWPAVHCRLADKLL